MNWVTATSFLFDFAQGKVDNPYLVTFLIMTPIFGWYVFWYGSKNGYQKDMCMKEIGLSVQNMITLGQMVNIIGGIYMTI